VDEEIECGRLVKRREIVNHSVLRLNKFLAVDNAPTAWNETSIIARGEKLYEQVREMWPAPERVSKAGAEVSSFISVPDLDRLFQELHPSVPERRADEAAKN
jgi:hypothetical protein